MSATAPRTRLTPGSRFLWQTVPAAVARLSALLGDSLSDGAYLNRWPYAGIVAPGLALVLGVVFGVQHFGRGDLYTTSLSVMIVLALIGQAGAGLGCWLLLGFCVGDAVTFHDDVHWGSGLGYVVRNRASVALTWALLGALVAVIPRAGQKLRQELSAHLRRWPRLQLAVGAVTSPIAAAGLTLAWVNAVPTLIRPRFTWQGQQPTVEAMEPLQHHGVTLVLCVAVAALARFIVEVMAARDPALRRDLWRIDFSVTGARHARPFPRSVAHLGRAAMLTFLLAGLIASWAEAVVVFVAVAGVLVVRDGMRTWLAWYARLVGRVPLILRMVAVTGLARVLSTRVIEKVWYHSSSWSTNTFRPVLVVAGISVALFVLLVPPAPPEKVGGR